MIRAFGAFACAVAVVAVFGDGQPPGRSEVVLRESDVVYSRDEPLERVLAVSLDSRFAGTRIDAATIEFTMEVDGEPDSFVPFLVSAQSVEPDGQGGYRVLGEDSAREIVVAPGARRPIRMLATSLVRRWLSTEPPSYLRIVVEEPVESTRPSGSVRLVASGDVLGKMVVLAR